MGRNTLKLIFLQKRTKVKSLLEVAPQFQNVLCYINLLSSTQFLNITSVCAYIHILTQHLSFSTVFSLSSETLNDKIKYRHPVLLSLPSQSQPHCAFTKADHRLILNCKNGKFLTVAFQVSCFLHLQICSHNSLSQVVENKEKQDEQVGLPGKGGKAKGKKAQTSEVLPSPQGKRVIPQVTMEMKAEAEKKIRKKIKVIL